MSEPLCVLTYGCYGCRRMGCLSGKTVGRNPIALLAEWRIHVWRNGIAPNGCW